MQLILNITGTRPMLMHNGRLANPIDPHTRELKQLTAKRKKTDEDLIDIMRVEARGSAYETTDELLGYPTQNVWKCVYSAATAFKRGEDIKRALSAADTTELLLVGGEQIKVATFLEDPANIDYRPVKVMGKKTMRARPIVHDWATTHTFELLEDVMDPRDLVPILERAGRLVGLGDWRPTFGTFTVEVSK